MTEALIGAYAIHPEIRGLIAENGQKAELGENVIRALREEYLKQGYNLSDQLKMKFLTESLPFEKIDFSELNGEDNLRLHDNFLATTYLRVHGPRSISRFQDWINTNWAALDYKSPKELILSGEMSAVVGHVYEAFNWETNA